MLCRCAARAKRFRMPSAALWAFLAEYYLYLPIGKICGFSRFTFLREGFRTNSLSQNLTVLPAPSGREPLACRKLCALAGNFPAMPKAPSQRTTSPGRGKMSRSDKKGNLASECETERVSQLKQKPPLIFANQKWSDVHYKVSSSCGSWARSSMTWGHTASSRLRDWWPPV